MKSWLIPMAAGFGAGILSAWGVGGGTLLLLVMTLILGVPQQQAAAVNLLYFLPTAAMGVIAHKRNGLLETEALKSAIPWGTTAAAAGALAATAVDTAVLRRGISAAGGRRQPAAAMAGTKAKIAANSGNKMYTICLLSVNIRRFAV